MNVIHEKPYDYFRFTKYSLKRIAERYGFKTVHLKAIGGEVLFWGHRLSVHIHKLNKSGKANGFIEALAYMLQKVTLGLDNKIQTGNFVCNYLSVFRK